MILPLAYTSLRILPNPSIREFMLTLNLNNMVPKEMKCKGLKLPNFSYGLSPLKRKPLQFFMAGVISAVVSTAVMTTLTAPLFIAPDDLKQVTKHQAEAKEALSSGLSQLTQIVHHSQLEIESIKNAELQSDKLAAGRFQWLKDQLTLQEHKIECLKAQQSLDAMMDEVRILLQTGQRRETTHFKTILYDRYHSSCIDGYCELHLLQIFLDNAVKTHYRMTDPRKLGDKFVTPRPTLLVVDDKSINTTYFYPRDRQYLSHKIYILYQN
jgi:hypothetical protein